MPTDVGTGLQSRCKARTKTGQPCQSFALSSGFCFQHDPSKAAARHAARSAGGKARHGRKLGKRGRDADTVAVVQVRSVADVVALLERGINDALALENSISRARALGALALAALKALEVGELENRIAVLEGVLKDAS